MSEFTAKAAERLDIHPTSWAWTNAYTPIFMPRVKRSNNVTFAERMRKNLCPICGKHPPKENRSKCMQCLVENSSRTILTNGKLKAKRRAKAIKRDAS